VAAAVTFVPSVYYLIRLQQYREADYRQAFQRAGAMVREMVEQAWGFVTRLSHRGA
jgi:hypothetical protein